VRLPKTRCLSVVCYKKDGKKCWGLRRREDQRRLG
jgi:hypothetical protein